MRSCCGSLHLVTLHWLLFLLLSPNTKKKRGDGYFPLQFELMPSIMVGKAWRRGRYGGRSRRQLVTLQPQSGEAERNQCCCEPVFPFIQSGTAAQETVVFCVTDIPEVCVCDDPNSCHLTAKMTHHRYFCAQHHTSFLPKITFFGHRVSLCRSG